MAGMRSIALTAAVLALVPASAAAQWEPVELPEPGGTPHLVFSDSGRALAVRGGPGRTTLLSSWKPGGAFGAARSIEGDLWERPVRVGRHRVLLVLQRGTPEASRLYSSVVGISGRTLQRPRRIRPFRAAYESAISSAGGEVALAWVEPAGTRDAPRLRLRLAIRPPGGAFRVVHTLDLGEDDHPGPAAVGVAHASGGRLAVAYTTERADGRRQVHALIGRPGRWRRQVLGLHRGIADMEAEANRRGRVVIAWQTQDGGEEGNLPAEVRAALLAPRAKAFGRTQLLDPGHSAERWPGRISAAVAPDGAVAVTWSQIAGRFSYPVVVATAAPGGRFGGLTTLDADGAAGDVAFAPDGRLLASWGRLTHGDYQSPDQAFAAQRAAGAAAFGPAEPLSEDVGARAPDLTLDPASGRFLAAFSLVPRYPDTSPPRPRLLIRAR